MEQEKREQARDLAWQKIARGYGNRPMFNDIFDAGHAAATAEGIPQADGWVDVADRLPSSPELIAAMFKDDDQNWVQFFFEPLPEAERFMRERFVAWMPIPPYQHKSEGDSK